MSVARTPVNVESVGADTGFLVAREAPTPPTSSSTTWPPSRSRRGHAVVTRLAGTVGTIRHKPTRHPWKHELPGTTRH